VTRRIKTHGGRASRAIDLFAGCGGLTLGLTQAGFNVVGAVEINSKAVDTYRANHPRVPVWECDIREVAATRMMRDLGLAPGQLDLLAGCPPCQGFSQLRTRNGARQNKDRRNSLILEMLRFARVFKPKAVMIENVPRLKNTGPFKKLRAGLRKLGYRVKWDLKDLARYGVPQRRKRLILVAGRNFEIDFAPEARKIKTVRSAIGKMAKAGISGDALHDMPERRSEKVLVLIKSVPKNGGSRIDLPRSRQLRCHRKFDGFNDVYGRMAWDDVAPTITGGCFNPSKGRFLHPHFDRAITLREAALLQTFPRRYRFPVRHGKETLSLMIGNALPPKFIHRQAVTIKSALRKQALRRM
jgi:DNA (cytosine-5)-methyltransferase 1